MTIKFIVYDAQGHPIRQFWKKLSHGTNNIAEYLALLALMNCLQENNVGQVQILGDSRLVINQVMGEWQVNQPHLADLAAQAQTLMRSHRGWRLSWIPGKLNDADGIGSGQ
ncbi:MAG: ribonuclease HI family protein [Desulfomonilaceae bacterium]